jgi:ribonuclease BN (tRNA processing enzyme)
VRRYAPEGPYPKLPLYAPAGARERLAGAYGSPDEGPLDDVYQFHTLRPTTFTIGPFTVTADRVEHPVETYGLRVEHAGRVLAYSGDTAPCDAILRLATGADAFLCEASYLASADNPPGLHMTGRDAGEAAAKAGAERLLLTHLVPAWGDEKTTLDEARSAFFGPIDLVRPGVSYDI